MHNIKWKLNWIWIGKWHCFVLNMLIHRLTTLNQTPLLAFCVIRYNPCLAVSFLEALSLFLILSQYAIFEDQVGQFVLGCGRTRQTDWRRHAAHVQTRFDGDGERRGPEIYGSCWPSCWFWWHPVVTEVNGDDFRIICLLDCKSAAFTTLIQNKTVVALESFGLHSLIKRDWTPLPDPILWTVIERFFVSAWRLAPYIRLAISSLIKDTILVYMWGLMDNSSQSVHWLLTFHQDEWSILKLNSLVSFGCDIAEKYGGSPSC